MFVLQCIWQPLIVGLEVSVLQACHVIQGVIVNMHLKRPLRIPLCQIY